MFKGRPPPTRFQCTVLLSHFAGYQPTNSGMVHVVWTLLAPDLLADAFDFDIGDWVYPTVGYG